MKRRHAPPAVPVDKAPAPTPAAAPTSEKSDEPATVRLDSIVFKLRYGVYNANGDPIDRMEVALKDGSPIEVHRAKFFRLQDLLADHEREFAKAALEELRKGGR